MKRPTPARAEPIGFRKPRILYVTPFWVHKPTIGAEVRASNVLRALKEIGHVQVVIVADSSMQAERGAVGNCNDTEVLELKDHPNRGFIGKLRWTFDASIPHANGCVVSKEAAAGVLGRLNEFDLIWFFKMRSATCFPVLNWERSVLDIDDIPSAYERSAMTSAETLQESMQAFRRQFSWKLRERRLGEQFTTLTVCSESDRDYLLKQGIKCSVIVIPNGVDTPSSTPVRRPSAPPRLGFIGLFDYFPNHEGIAWFAKECWPRIKQVVPEARLRLVGKGSDGALTFSGPDIDGLGWLEKPADEMSTWSAMVVPIRFGGGTRVKISQAFSQKVPVVATSIGSFGYPVLDGRELFMADTAEAFSDACIRAICEPDRATAVAERAWRSFLQQWSWDAIRPRVWSAAEACMQASRS